jgi:alpha-glucosidase
MQKSCFSLLAVLICLSFALPAKDKDRRWNIKSPDGKIELTLQHNSEKGTTYSIRYNEKIVLEPSSLGVEMNDIDFTSNYGIESVSKVQLVEDRYDMLQGKKAVCNYRGNEQIIRFVKSGKSLGVIFRVSNDGVAFRYDFSALGNESKEVMREKTTFNFTTSSKGFLQPMSVAKSGWSRVNPCYEEHYEMGIPVSKASAFRQGWVYPALFEVSGQWVLITEAGLEKNYCGTHLSDANEEGIFTIAFPQKDEKFPGGGLNPLIAGRKLSPWRIILIGGLKTVIESTLGTDLATPALDTKALGGVKPGHASWSWALLKDDSTVFSVQRKFVDYAAEMGWEYCLVDASWDKMIGYDKIRELSSYAQSKGVGLILWYNSAGDWNDTPYTPKNAMLSHESRVKEFSRLREIGIKGLKIDFFGGDGQSFIKYYLDILEDATAYNLMINFHGSTLPRGWHRTYPNFVSCEAIKGFEYVTFDQTNADLQPSHCAMLPFTRNAFDPMDFTPLSLYKVPNIERRTSSAFELALSVVFLSGVQHFVETPAGMAHVPDFVKAYLRDLPVTWEESKFITGYPGKDVVLARRSGDTWYVAGINGQNSSTNFDIDLSFAGKSATGYLIHDGKDALSFEKQVLTTAGGKMGLTIPPHGGFVMVLSTKETP